MSTDGKLPLSDMSIKVKDTVTGEHLIHQTHRIAGIYKDTPHLQVWTSEKTWLLAKRHMTWLYELQQVVLEKQNDMCPLDLNVE